MYQNKIIATPLIINLHFSLLLFYNSQIFLLDFGLYHSSDENKSKKREKYNSLEKEIK